MKFILILLIAFLIVGCGDCSLSTILKKSVSVVFNIAKEGTELPPVVKRDVEKHFSDELDKIDELADTTVLDNIKIK